MHKFAGMIPQIVVKSESGDSIRFRFFCVFSWGQMPGALLWMGALSSSQGRVRLGGIFLENTLIVSHSEKPLSFFLDMLRSASYHNVAVAATCGEARRLLLERDFDLCIINAPLPDESGESLSRHISSKGVSQVILVVHAGVFEQVSHAVEDYGVITVSTPLDRQLFWSALKLVKATQNKLKVMKGENENVIKKMENIRIVDRAKRILISYLNMSEPEAHKYIEKQSMDMRVTKRAIAEGILKNYEG